ncbi:MAG: hypothetical protein CM15mP55_2220 [Hyphomicrobiales bacterium]|nr:MAG: hypothetical protein CM15mP55_2220 [Hyphomicrobiales bacterium]
MSAPITHAMVLAAGLGTRMRARAEDPPKPLTEVAGRTLLDRLLDRLEQAGMTHIVINLHHKAERISDHLAQRDGAEIVYSDERTELLETGGGVKKALPLLGPILSSSAMGIFSGRKMPISWLRYARALMRRAWTPC